MDIVKIVHNYCLRVFLLSLDEKGITNLVPTYINYSHFNYFSTMKIVKRKYDCKLFPDTIFQGFLQI